MLKRGRYSERSSVTAGVFMAAILEYLVAEIFEAAKVVCDRRKALSLTPKDINLAIRNDPELSKLMCDASISQGGMLLSLIHI